MTLPAVLSGVGALAGAGGNKKASNNAQNNANQSTAAQNQLIQQGILPGYEALQGAYSQYGPNALAGLAGPLGALSGSAGQDVLNGQQGYGGLGAGATGALGSALNYYANPGSTTLSGLTPSVLAQLQSGATQLQGASPLQGSAAQGIFQNIGQTGGALGSLYPGLASGYNQIAGGQGALGGLAPGLQSFYQGEESGGLSPQTIGAANAQYNQGTQQTISSLRNSLGAGAPNIGGSINDALAQAFQGSMGLQTQLAGMNQGVMQQGAQGLSSLGSTLDQQTLSALSGLGGLGNTLSGLQLQGASGLQGYQSALNNANLSNLGGAGSLLTSLLGAGSGLDTQQANLYGAGASLGSNVLNYGAGLGGGTMSSLQNLYNSLSGGLGTGTAGLGSVANMYGQSASGNQAIATNLGNPLQGIGNTLGNLSSLPGLSSLFSNGSGAAMGSSSFGSY